MAPCNLVLCSSYLSTLLSFSNVVSCCVSQSCTLIHNSVCLFQKETQEIIAKMFNGDFNAQRLASLNSVSLYFYLFPLIFFSHVTTQQKMCPGSCAVMASSPSASTGGNCVLPSRLELYSSC